MKALLISFVVGLFVGVAYGLIRVKRPAPPIIALIGLLGVVLGEQSGGWLLTKEMQVTSVVSSHIAGERKDHHKLPSMHSVIAALTRRSQQ